MDTQKKHALKHHELEEAAIRQVEKMIKAERELRNKRPLSKKVLRQRAKLHHKNHALNW